MECFGILRAQDDSKDLQWQEQSNAEDNSKGKNKKQNKDKAKTDKSKNESKCGGSSLRSE